MNNLTKKKKNNNLVWIVLGIFALAGIGAGIYFFTKNSSESTNNSPNPNIQYLPHEEEAQNKINQIKTTKNIDDQQATIEFLTAYVPHIKWWEINSLLELDEKIALVNSKTGFPPFSSLPSVDEFNQEFEKNFGYKSLAFIVSIIPRESDGNIDWKGLDFQNYMLTFIKPLTENNKFKPTFATQENYQKLARRIKEETNSQFSSLTSQFASISKVDELNNLVENLLSKFFQGDIYASIHDELGPQLEITNHQEFKLQKTGNQSLNHNWNIYLNEFAFKGGSEPEPNDDTTARVLQADLKTVEEHLTKTVIPEQKKIIQQNPHANDNVPTKQKMILGLHEEELQKVKKFQNELLSTTSYDKERLTKIRNAILKWSEILKR